MTTKTVDPLYASASDDEESLGGSRENDPASIKVQVTFGGPVTPLFQAKTDLQHSMISFSQRRRKGFRQSFEFDKKRVMVADEKWIQVFGYAEEMEPFHIVSYSVDQTNQEVGRADG